MVSEARSSLDVHLGMEVYGSSDKKVEGVIRKKLEDFIVEEIPLQGGTSGNLLLLVVEKKGIDTLTAAFLLSKKLGVALKDIGFAGLKDTRAIARQRFTVKLPNPEGFDASTISSNKLKVIAVHRAKKHLRPGMLLGNSFTVIIRDLRLPANEAKAVVEDIFSELEKLGGAPNFYGYQRFGLNRPNTHIVGKLLIQGDYEKAVLEILATPYPNEPRSHREAREFLAETMDFKRALRKFPKILIFERQMLKRLARKPNDYLGSLKVLPKYVLSLYVDAYLAYVFNKALSERLRKLLSLRKVVEGDIVARCDAYGNPVRPTLVAKSPSLELKREETVLAFVPACVKVRIEGYMNELILSIFRREGVEPPFKSLENVGLQGRLGLLRSIAFKPISFSLCAIDEEDALKLNFILPKSSYATVFLREFMKPEDPIAAGF